jgi:CheY-like chemotaxis protein
MLLKMHRIIYLWCSNVTIKFGVGVMMTNIIIMDNRPYIRYRVKELLQKDTMAIHEVANSTQLFSKFKELNNDVALIILEIHLKDEDGIEIIKKLRKRNIAVPFMVLTSVNTREAFIKSVKAGAVDYFLKPFNAKDFSKRVISHAMTKDITVIEIENEENSILNISDYTEGKIKIAKLTKASVSFIMFIVFKSENDLTIDLSRDNEVFTDFAYDKMKGIMSEANRFEKHGSNIFIGIYPSLSEKDVAVENEKLLKSFDELKRKESSFSKYYFDSVCATFPQDGGTYEEIVERLTTRINNKIVILQRKKNNH